jgi:hypothetical protein
MNSRLTWTIVFVASILAYSVIAAFGTTWFSIIASTIPLLGAVSSYSYLYNQGRGVPETDNAPRRPDR